MCTVLLRFAPGTRSPLLLAAVRDEFLGRPWDPPAAHWPGTPYLGGRDRVGGGTWLAVDPTVEPGHPPAVAALLNGRPLPPPADGVRPTRGGLPLSILAGAGLTAGAGLPAGAELARYDAFHLLRATPDRVEAWSWDGVELAYQVLPPGDHIVVNDGVDAAVDPLVPHFAPLLAKAASPDPRPGPATVDAWGNWVDLLVGGGLAGDDPRALIVRREFFGRAYGSSSATLVALRPDGVRYDFAVEPGPGARWREIATIGG